jgi:uncharacterized protein (TIGR02145 family)
MVPKIKVIKIILFGLLLILTAGCRKDEIITVSDIDGNLYNTLTIGAQIWIAENLKTTRYSNGDLIGTTDPPTLNTGIENNPKYQWAYNGDENNAAVFGRLYTWFTVTDSRNICPTGWRVPDDSDWHTLILSLDNGASLSIFESTTAGSKLKETGTVNWLSPNSGATNESGFTALPGGYRYNNGVFYYLGSSSIWWSSTGDPGNDGNAWKRTLTNGNSGVGRDTGCKYDGYSVRCLRNK